MTESYGGNIPARIWARFMKAALAKTPKHDFAFPVGEVRRVTLCGSGEHEVFLAGTEPAHTCGDGDTPPLPAPRQHHHAVAAAAAAKADGATPAADPTP
jgi:membrane carboxypeptidase/penicillin-binding protein